LCYWSDALLDPEVGKMQVPVRYDPFDAGIAYAFIKGRWVQCLSEHYAIFTGRSKREIQLATAELRKRKQLHGQRLTITARKLADFLTSLEAEELLLEQRLRDTEARAMLTTPEQLPSSQTIHLHEKEALSIASSEQDKDETMVIYEDF